METRFFPATGRGHIEYDWLDTYHSFSFGHFYDPALMGFGALRVVNDDTIAPGTGFGKHAHRDMEIITIPLSGALAHEDNTGGKGVVRSGDVQVMSAGFHVAHSEVNASETEPVSLFQIWIQTAKPGAEPRYDQKTFDATGRKDKWELIVSPDGRDGSLMIHQNAFLTRYDFVETKASTYSLFDPRNAVFIMVVEGEATIGAHSLRRRDALGVSALDTVKIEAAPKTSLLLIEVPNTTEDE